ncbi:MAG: holo-ACP synthase, partial [Candidatus Omnitrophota bacterium]|nr:holo-ACP synthase [Candidatus Omnitrophota bacterium]
MNSVICGMGVAMDDITRLKKVIRDLPSLKKVFSGREIGYCMRFSFPEEHFAVRLAAKKATIKALGRKGGGISMMEIP